MRGIIYYLEGTLQYFHVSVHAKGLKLVSYVVFWLEILYFGLKSREMVCL
jgi:hypothetical protein